ncbi:hypothetical protein K491DRAFT_330099 [Lophiostoma macrostomum CBS 122681]|uniref:Uncharacterized protein n=1 Tax=Lophiostoma macrostomum CBS 122681 TaxID=1314788 RepID=A0A6A6TCX2_9PLEO|nr:hypothetical protein K491DRAFT_330099 [Lophiostoma macrostomum CBS 122681]
MHRDGRETCAVEATSAGPGDQWVPKCRMKASVWREDSQPHFTYALRLLHSRNHPTKTSFCCRRIAISGQQDDLSASSNVTPWDRVWCAVALHLSTSFMRGYSTNFLVVFHIGQAFGFGRRVFPWYRPFARASIWPGWDRRPLVEWPRNRLRPRRSPRSRTGSSDRYANRYRPRKRLAASSCLR